MSKRLKIIFGALMVVALATTVMISMNEDQNRLAQVQDKVTTGQASIGGDFSLVDHNNKKRTSKDFQGKYMMVYFGYTFCPDICPTGLSSMTEALEMVGPLRDKIQPLFITVDPERDTVESMATYMQNFHPKFLALTGTKEQVKQAAKAYKVYASRVNDNSSTEYIIDHSSIIYIMDKKGHYIGHFNHATPAAEMAEKLKELIS